MRSHRNPSTTDWARLAAFIDGEGCVSIQTSATTIKGKKYRTHVLRISVYNCNPKLAVWCRATFGSRIHPRKARKSNWKPGFEWVAQSDIAAWVLHGCLPYFLLKREQAEVALAFQETKKSYRRQGVPSEVLRDRNNLQGQMASLNKRGVDVIEKVN